MLFLTILTLLVLAALALSIVATVGTVNNSNLPSSQIFVGNLSGKAEATTVTTTTGMTLPGPAKWQLDTPQDLESSASPTFGNINLPPTTSTVGQYKIGGTSVLNSFGVDNTLVGAGAGNFTMTGHENVALGAGAGTGLSSGNDNIAVGTGSLSAGAVTGKDNIGIGRIALASVTSGDSNTAVGAGSLTKLTTGINNTAYGLNALGSGTTMSFSTAVGANALFSNTATDNTAVGSNALFSNTTGTGNTAMGSGALLANVTGVNNTGIGLNALTLATGSSNVAVGFSANAAAETGNGQTALGTSAMAVHTSGASNTAVGFAALSTMTTGANNVAIGKDALLNLVGNATANVAIGQGAGTAYTTTESNNILIKHAGVIGDQTTTRIGTQGTQTKCFAAGIFGVNVVGGTAVVVDLNGQLGQIVSSRKFKDMIQPLASDLSAKVLSLEPVTFHFKSDESKSQQMGLIAEDVEAVLPSLVTYDEKKEAFSVKYQDLPILLLNEMKKLKAEVDALKARVTQLETPAPPAPEEEEHNQDEEEEEA